MKFEISKSSRIEKVIFDKDNFYKLLEDYLECDGGIIVKISDRDMIKNDYIEMGFEEDEMLFSDEDGNDKNINDVVVSQILEIVVEGIVYFMMKIKII